ncbi:MAG: hypothetical protein ACLGIR_11875 [Actinomycetes bacterium]
MSEGTSAPSGDVRDARDGAAAAVVARLRRVPPAAVVAAALVVLVADLGALAARGPAGAGGPVATVTVDAPWATATPDAVATAAPPARPSPRPELLWERDGRIAALAVPSPEPSPPAPSPAPPAPSPAPPAPSPAAAAAAAAPAVPAVPAPPAVSAPPARPARPAPWTVAVHQGYGAWIDVYDWSHTHSNGRPKVTVDTMDELAARGVQTLYIQTARPTSPVDVVEPERLTALIARARASGMAVVTWYLPTFVDLEVDLRRVRAAMALDVDGFALDIEATDVEDVDERNRRYLALSRQMRADVGDRALVATVISPVALEDLAPGRWPRFPWKETAELYDVIQPMNYFTYREESSGWRDAERYTAENIRRIRRNTGRPDVPVHTIGGIGNLTTVEDVEGMTRAARAERAMGASLYDVATTHEALWAPMRAWRELR